MGLATLLGSKPEKTGADGLQVTDNRFVEKKSNDHPDLSSHEHT
jgi:hypothetical protein